MGTKANVERLHLCLWTLFRVLVLLILIQDMNHVTSLENWDFSQADEDGVCKSMEIKGSARNLMHLENCTVIEGHLQVMLMDQERPEDFEGLTFPKLREVTDYVMFFRVAELTSLGKLFPNLAVIRGNSLFMDRALIIYQMPDLQQISLTSLMDIINGTVLIKENPNLCYVNTIDWGQIAKAGQAEHAIENNKHAKFCPDTCPENCPRMTRSGEQISLCWDSKTCQKVCSPECSRQNLSCFDGNRCCHAQCIGGCYEPTLSSNCVACRNVIVGGKLCMKQCVAASVEYMGRRCISRDDCKSKSDDKHKYKAFEKKCLPECPKDYTEVEGDPHTCTQCNKDGISCPKECPGGIIASIASSQAFRGCTRIEGSLDIQIPGGKNVQSELEINLGSIQEIKGYLKIARSYPLASLYFLKNLRVIHGEELDRGNYSFLVLDNQNLQELWNWKERRERKITLHIKRGKVFFHLNPQLCLKKIKELKDTSIAKVPNWNSLDVSLSTNGEKAPCNITSLNVSVNNPSPNKVLLSWHSFSYNLTDPRSLLGYVLYYREAPNQNITKYDDFSACGNVVWQEQLYHATSASSVLQFLPRVKPFTLYAMYVKTYMIASEERGAESPLLFLKTLPGTPSFPAYVIADATSSSEVLIKWSPPTETNGPMGHYVVNGFLDDGGSLAKRIRSSCGESAILSDVGSSSEKFFSTKQISSTNMSLLEKHSKDMKCCPCDSENDPHQVEDRYEADFHRFFENKLQDIVFVKRPLDRKKRVVDLNERLQVSTFVGSSTSLPSDTAVISSMAPTLEDSWNETITTTVASVTPIPVNVKVNNVYHRFQKNVTHETLFLLIKELRHFSRYTIQVIACRDKAAESPAAPCGEEKTTTVRTLPKAGADDIDSKSVRISQDNSTQGVYVKWSEPLNPNGLIISYQIEYRRNHTAKATRECITYEHYQELKGAVLKHLAPGDYVLRVRARSLAGFGNWTELHSFPVYGTADSPVTKTLIAFLVVLLLCIVAAVAAFIFYFLKLKGPKGLDYWTSNPDYMTASDWEILDRWEIPMKEIELLRELGHGAFGKVQEGKWLKPNSQPIKCAVKTVNEFAPGSERAAFLREATVMTAFDCHHIVKLLGVVTRAPVPLVLMELMENGDLKTYLLSLRSNTEIPQIKAPPVKKCLEMAIQIADGMAYLSHKKFVHRDLAARNCMVAADLTVKIGDFGMARDTYMSDYYRRGENCRQPVRWMSPESLKDGVFTSQSDVWSYGVVLWEIATLACQPYTGLSNEEVYNLVMGGGILEEPENCPKQLWCIMEACWKKNPNARPTFIDLIEMLIPNSSPQFHEVSFYFTQYNKDDQEQADADTPLTPLRSPTSENDAGGDTVSFDDGEGTRYFPGGLAMYAEELELNDVAQGTTEASNASCSRCNNSQACRGDCGNTSRSLCIHSNEGSKGMSVPSLDGSASSSNLANGHIRSRELVTAC